MLKYKKNTVEADNPAIIAIKSIGSNTDTIYFLYIKTYSSTDTNVKKSKLFIFSVTNKKNSV